MLSGTNGKLVLVACCLFLIQQASGINAIVYFSTQVFKDAGVQNGTMASAVVGLVNTLGTVIAASLMDRAGRKCAPCKCTADRRRWASDMRSTMQSCLHPRLKWQRLAAQLCGAAATSVDFSRNLGLRYNGVRCAGSC